MPSVAIVEDHLLLGETLCVALAQRAIHATVVEPAQRELMLATLLTGQHDLVVLDLDLGQFGDSSPLIAPLTNGGLPVLIVTGTTDRLKIAAALELGAVGYQSKATGFDDLLAAICAALTGTELDTGERTVLLRELADARAEQRRANAGFALLTQRERGTLAALADGRTVHDIAVDWVVSEATVRTHVRGVLVKLGVTSQLAAVVQAQRNGWVQPPG